MSPELAASLRWRWKLLARLLALLLTQMRSTGGVAQWLRKAMIRDVSTRPLACPIACSLTLLTHSYCLLVRLLRPACFAHAPCCAQLRSFVHSLTHSRARGEVYDEKSQNDLVLPHSVPGMHQQESSRAQAAAAPHARASVGRAFASLPSGPGISARHHLPRPWALPTAGERAHVRNLLLLPPTRS